MKVRIGISLGTAGEPAGFAAAVDLLEAAGIDSLWMPEHVYGAAVEPFTGITYALARTARLKAGSGISVLPGRHPVLVAKQLASLAGLAPGRVLPVFGLRPALPAERELFPVPAGQRAAVFDEALTLLRQLLTSETVSFSGSFYTVDGASIRPLPAKPLDIWLAGSAPAALRRVGRLADGWLGSLLTPPEAAEAVRAIQRAAAGAGREVDPDHFGISLTVTFNGMPAAVAESIARRRPDVAPQTLVAHGWADTRRLISAYVDAGLSKFVVRQAGPPEPGPGPGTGPGPASFEEFVAGFTAELMPLQN
jgi:probable F420-dependent oxidoreductase